MADFRVCPLKGVVCGLWVGHGCVAFRCPEDY